MEGYHTPTVLQTQSPGGLCEAEYIRPVMQGGGGCTALDCVPSSCWKFSHQAGHKASVRNRLNSFHLLMIFCLAYAGMMIYPLIIPKTLPNSYQYLAYSKCFLVIFPLSYIFDNGNDQKRVRFFHSCMIFCLAYAGMMMHPRFCIFDNGNYQF